MTRQEDKFILKDVLALDRLYGFLTQYERHLCHLSILGRYKGSTERIDKAIQLIKDTQWKEPPSMYQPDRVLYYSINQTRVPASKYKDPIEEQVNKILK
ncbi:hypothetical protein [Myroides odoratimimus]|uniref:hypothetical protein n=1 Tax=Myroides odoratimimus TaxID=76832 RepID=UPI002575CBBC|nr:hypothetical protein [Myroides odoratimimus]MDM1093396.1 hypothetical protein [Myroides odoratimimus]